MLRRERTECAGSTLAPPQRKKSNVYEDMRTWSVLCSTYWQLHICHDSNAEIIKLPFGKRDEKQLLRGQLSAANQSYLKSS